MEDGKQAGTVLLPSVGEPAGEGRALWLLVSPPLSSQW